MSSLFSLPISLGESHAVFDDTYGILKPHGATNGIYGAQSPGEGYVDGDRYADQYDSTWSQDDLPDAYYYSAQDVKAAEAADLAALRAAEEKAKAEQRASV